MSDSDRDWDALFGQIPVLRTLPLEVIDELRPQAQRETLPAGHYLFRQGEPQPERVFCLLTATAEVLVGPPEQERSVSLARPGQLLGFLSLYSHEPSPVSVRIAHPGEVATVPAELLRQLAERHPAVGQVLAATMAERLQDVLREVLAQGAGAAVLHHAETFPFRRRVRDAMSHVVVTLPPGATAGEAAAALRENGAGAVVVVEGEQPVGIVTEKDLVARVLAAGRDGATTLLRDVMSAPIHAIDSDSYVYKAMGFMRTRHVLFLPVLDDGRLTGLLSIRDLLTLGTRDTLSLVEQIENADSVELLREILARRTRICLSLLEDNVPATEVSQILSSVNRDLQRRALEICLANMKSEGKGDPPAPFCLIAMGSHGRAENHFGTDQDHGLILGDLSSERRAAAEAYFADLGTRYTAALDRIGFPLCTGGVMSENPQWRKPLAEWRQELVRWFADLDPVTVRRTTVFYDFVPLWGDVTLAARLRSFLTEGVLGNTKLIRALFEDSAHHKVPLTFFKGFVTEKSGPYKGHMELKESGLRFVVECARVLSLLHGVTKLGTLQRLEELERLGVVPAAEGRFIRGAYESFVRLLFQAQAAKLRAGQEPNAYVYPPSLSVEERYLLRLGLEATERLQMLVHAAVHTPFVAGLQPRAG